jgi:hypothetical protein
MLIGGGLQVLLALGLHGGVDDHPDEFGQKGETLLANLFQEFGW